MLFYKDFQPFSIVQDKGFRQYTKALNSSYDIPSRQVISKTFVTSFYEECLEKCKEKIKEVQAVSLTTDCWTSGNNESFMGVTIHFIDEDFKLQTMLLKCAVFNVSHTSANLSADLNNITEEWGVRQKVVLAISDNAANITSAIKNGTGWKFFGCYAHTLNLIVKDALNVQPEITEIIGKVKTIVTHFKQSSKATAKLITFQNNSGIKPSKKLLQDVVTRWNSTFHMIERFVELEETVRSTVALLDAALPQLSPDEWCILMELRTILEPFEDATRAISGQQYLVSSLAIVITGGLLDVCQELLKIEMKSSTVAVIKKLQHGLRNRLGNLEYSNTLAITTFLDPRFKGLPFKNNDALERVKKNVIAELAEEISKKEAEPRQPDSEKNEATSGETEQKKTEIINLDLNR